MPHLRWLILLLYVAAIIAPTHALAESAESDWYQIELIVFAYNAEDSGITEEWPQDLQIPDWSEATPLTPYPAQPGSEGHGTPAHITMVPKSGYQLTSAMSSLGRTAGRLQPLLHLAWRQPTTTSDKAEWLYLQVPFEGASTMDAPEYGTPRLEGAVRISRSRYLHVDLDLVLREVSAQSDAITDYYSTIAYSPFRIYRMQTHRRMRSKELHYIDHPLMGVLVEITPYEPPKPKAAAPAPEPRMEPVTASPAPAQPAVAQPTNPSE